jgi:hypothetical protein
MIIKYVGMRVLVLLLASAEFDKSYVVQSRDSIIDSSCYRNELRLINYLCNLNIVLQDR